MFKAEAGRKIKILFSTKDAKGHLFYEADNQVDVRIQAPSGNFVKKKIEDNLNGNYTVSFTSDIIYRSAQRNNYSEWSAADWQSLECRGVSISIQTCV